MIVALLVTACFTGPFLLAFGDAERPALSEVLVCVCLGLAALSALDIGARALGLPLTPTLLAGAVPAGAVTAIGLRRRGLPRGWLGGLRERGPSLALALLFAAPVLLAGARMGVGDWPPVFFNADTGLYLTHVHELLADEGYPPASLFNVGEHFRYHYGTQNTAAVLARLSGAAPHRVLFLVIGPLLVLGCAAAAWRIAERAARSGVPHALVMLIALFFVEYPLGRMAERFLRDLDEGWGAALGAAVGALGSSQIFRGGYPLLSRHQALFFTLVTVYVLFFAERRRSAWLAVFSIGLLPLFKPAYFIGTGALAGLWALAVAHRTRALGVLAIPATALALGGALTATNVNPTATLVFSWRALAENWSKELTFGAHALLAAVIATRIPRDAVAAAAGERPRWVPWAASLVTLALAAVLVTEFIDYRQQRARHWDAAQMLYPSATFLAAAVILRLTAAWGRLDAAGRRRLASILIGITALPLGYQLASCGFVLLRPERWHEYADNRPIGRALREIPVAGSVIATNDLRYPANGFRRDGFQMQIPALFGHQAYACNPRYEQFPDALRRIEKQRMLNGGVWGAEHDAAAAAEGWTHVLIHKPAPAVAGIPGRVLHDGPRYRVHELAAP